MATGTSRGFVPHVLPALGEYEQVQQTAATDIATITGASGQTGDFLVLRDSTNVEKFVVTSAGILERFAMRTVSKATSYSVLSSDSGTIFDNTGAAGTVTFTLPAVATSTGVVVGIIASADFQVTVTAPAGTLVTFNNAAATSLNIGTAAGRILGGGGLFVCNGAKWLAFQMPAVGAAVTEALMTKYSIA